MKKLSKDEMKNITGGIAQLKVTGWTNGGNGNCTVDLCFVDSATGAMTDCHCNQPTQCASWM